MLKLPVNGKGGGGMVWTMAVTLTLILTLGPGPDSVPSAGGVPEDQAAVCSPEGLDLPFVPTLGPQPTCSVYPALQTAHV